MDTGIITIIIPFLLALFLIRESEPDPPAATAKTTTAKSPPISPIARRFMIRFPCYTTTMLNVMLNSGFIFRAIGPVSSFRIRQSLAGIDESPEPRGSRLAGSQRNLLPGNGFVR